MLTMKIVVDTNIIVGAVLGTGAANGVVAACLEGRCTPLMGSTLFNEFEDVFSRNDLFQDCKLNLDERNDLLDIFYSCCEWRHVYYLWRPNLPDEADNHLIELAIAGGADFVVTRNLRHLKHMELRFPQLRIVAPEAYLKEI